MQLSMQNEKKLIIQQGSKTKWQQNTAEAQQQRSSSLLKGQTRAAAGPLVVVRTLMTLKTDGKSSFLLDKQTAAAARLKVCLRGSVETCSDRSAENSLAVTSLETQNRTLQVRFRSTVWRWINLEMNSTTDLVLLSLLSFNSWEENRWPFLEGCFWGKFWWRDLFLYSWKPSLAFGRRLLLWAPRRFDLKDFLNLRLFSFSFS